MNAMPCDVPGNIVNTIDVIDVVDDVDALDDVDGMDNLDNMMAWTMLTTSTIWGTSTTWTMLMTLTTMTIIIVQPIPGISRYTVTGYRYLYEQKSVFIGFGMGDMGNIGIGMNSLLTDTDISLSIKL